MIIYYTILSKGIKLREPTVPLRSLPSRKSEGTTYGSLISQRQYIMSKSALLVGCNYPGTSNQLVGCINDIINMYNLLTTEYGYLPQNIVMLYDTYQTNLPQQYLIPGQDNNTPTPASQSQNLPTQANITAHLQQLTVLSNSQTEIWFHYSGHGSKSQMLQGSGLPKNEEVIIPTDSIIPYNTFDFTKLYTADMFYAFVQTINSNCNTVLLFDSCFSASMCELPYSFNYISGNKFQETTNKSHKIANHNIYMFSGSTDKQTSASVPESVIIPGKPSNVFVGAFTETFIQCLKENNYNMLIEPLCAKICKELKKDGLTQHPILSTSNPNPKYMFKSINISVPAPIPVHIHQPKQNLHRRRRKRNQIKVTKITSMLRKTSLRHFLLRLN